MLDKNKHEVVQKNLLKDIYKNSYLSQVLVFKGGTAVALFYDLPRFSVDLDFDLKTGLSSQQRTEVIMELEKIGKEYGEIEDCLEKRFTLFLLLSYKAEMQKIKIEVSKRAITDIFELRDFYGVGVAVLPKELMFSEKLAAITNRRGIANRDIMD